MYFCMINIIFSLYSHILIGRPNTKNIHSLDEAEDNFYLNSCTILLLKHILIKILISTNIPLCIMKRDSEDFVICKDFNSR